jgi:hypothetical protein
MTPRDLVLEIFTDERHPLARDFAAWLAAPRFKAFAETYRGKIRKKFKGLRDEEGRRDLRFELEAAYWLAQQRHFTVEYEKQHTPGKPGGPDFTVTFKTRLPFNVEATRIRATSTEPASDERLEIGKLRGAICHKLLQLPPSTINLLVIGTEDPGYDEPALLEAVALLKLRAEQKVEPFFEWHGFQGTTDFWKHYRRLSGVVLRPVGAQTTTVLWPNPHTKHPLPPDLANILRR